MYGATKTTFGGHRNAFILPDIYICIYVINVTGIILFTQWDVAKMVAIWETTLLNAVWYFKSNLNEFGS